MAAVDQVSPGVHAGPGQLHLALLGAIFQFAAPVEHADDVIRPLLLQLLHTGHGLFQAGVAAFRLAHRVQVTGGIDAHFDAAFGGNDLGLLVLAVGHTNALQGGLGVLHAGVIEVPGVVVGHGDKVHPALGQDVDPLRRAEEVEVSSGVVIGQILVGEAALQIAQGDLVIGEILNGVGKGIAVVPVHLGGVVQGVLLVAVQGQIADAGDGEILRLRFRGRLRGRLGSSLRRGDRQGVPFRGGRGVLAAFGHNGQGHVQPGLGDEYQRQAQQGQANDLQNLFHIHILCLY